MHNWGNTFAYPSIQNDFLPARVANEPPLKIISTLNPETSGRIFCGIQILGFGRVELKQEIKRKNEPPQKFISILNLKTSDKHIFFRNQKFSQGVCENNAQLGQ